jgi:hypothetical protein
MILPHLAAGLNTVQAAKTRVPPDSPDRPPDRLERDDFSSNRHPALFFCLSMIFSENRHPLFRIML